MVCSSCLGVAQQKSQQQGVAQAAKAKRAIMWSWVFTAIVGIGAFSIASSQQSAAIDVIAFPLSFYGAWSLYWGWGPVWNGWRKRLVDRLSSLPDQIHMVLLVFFVFISALIAITYGALGGGYNEFRKAQKVAQ